MQRAISKLDRYLTSGAYLAHQSESGIDANPSWEPGAFDPAETGGRLLQVLDRIRSESPQQHFVRSRGVIEQGEGAERFRIGKHALGVLPRLEPLPGLRRCPQFDQQTSMHQKAGGIFWCNPASAIG